MDDRRRTITLLCWIAGGAACLGAVVAGLLRGDTSALPVGLLIVGVLFLVAGVLSGGGGGSEAEAAPPAASDEGAGGGSLSERINRFLEEVVRPTFEELASELEQDGKVARVIAGFDATGSEAGVLEAMHPRGVTLDRFEWGSTAPADGYLGYSLVVRDPELEEQDHPPLGTYANSVMLRVAGANRILASPMVMYYLKKTSQYHIFSGRYRPDEARQDIATVDAAMLEAQFQRSFARFRREAPREEPEPA